MGSKPCMGGNIMMKIYKGRHGKILGICIQLIDRHNHGTFQMCIRFQAFAQNLKTWNKNNVIKYKWHDI